jgi:hypothetical protein
MNMKKILYSLCLFCSLALFAGCEGVTTEDPSKITYFITFDVLGGETVTVELGSAYTDPGVIATEGETDVTKKVITKGSVDPNKKGIYTITYSGVNVDGFASSATRTVFVYDPNITTDISGSYAVDIDYSNRFQFSNKAVIKYSDMGSMYGGDFSKFTVNFEQLVPGIFSVSDLYGGYYVAGRLYAASYLMSGYVSLNADNTIDLLSSYVPGWRDGLDELNDASYDPETGSIQWGAVYAGSYSFNVKVDKK